MSDSALRLLFKLSNVSTPQSSSRRSSPVRPLLRPPPVSFRSASIYLCILPSFRRLWQTADRAAEFIGIAFDERLERFQRLQQLEVAEGANGSESTHSRGSIAALFPPASAVERQVPSPFQDGMGTKPSPWRTQHSSSQPNVFVLLALNLNGAILELVLTMHF